MRQRTISRLSRSAIVVVIAGLVPAITASAATSSQNPPRCLSSQMRVSLGPVSTTFVIEGRRLAAPVIFTNMGARCTIWGTPILQPVVGSTHRLASPPARSQSMGQMPAVHLVARGGSVSTTFTDTVYFSLATCSPRSADGLVVEVPTFVRAHYLALTMTVCSGMTSTTTRLLSPGARG